MRSVIRVSGLNLAKIGVTGRTGHESLIFDRTRRWSSIAGGFSRDGEVGRARTLGPTVFLAKSYSPVELGTAVRDALGLGPFEG